MLLIRTVAVLEHVQEHVEVIDVKCSDRRSEQESLESGASFKFELVYSCMQDSAG